jgi:hypothetical protein
MYILSEVMYPFIFLEVIYNGGSKRGRGYGVLSDLSHRYEILLSIFYCHLSLYILSIFISLELQWSFSDDKFTTAVLNFNIHVHTLSYTLTYGLSDVFYVSISFKAVYIVFAHITGCLLQIKSIFKGYFPLHTLGLICLFSDWHFIIL